MHRLIEALESRRLFAVTVPAGFVDEGVVSGLHSPTAAEFAPDGRIFVAEQGGDLRVIRNGVLQANSAVTLNLDASGERGLLGVAVDPNFETNHFLYLYYTVTSPSVHNRVSRFTLSGDTVVPGSQVDILNLETLGSSTYHNGGALHFGVDGKLYVAVGENNSPANSQSLATRLGKILRINADGTIPNDNPFFNATSGANRAIWALGLRNPFTFAVQPTTGRIFINDVGESTWEEIDEGVPGANYGWPTVEGPVNNPAYTQPIFAYNHSQGIAITGGAFYNPANRNFPSAYVGGYFYADLGSGFVRRLDLSGNGVQSVNFATGLSRPVDLDVGNDGALYYLENNTGQLRRIRATVSDAPSITDQPDAVTVVQGGPATFTVAAAGQGTLTYQWQRNGQDIQGETSPTLTIPAVTSDLNGSEYRVVVTNLAGSTTSNAVKLTVTQAGPPTVKVAGPKDNALYKAGQAFRFSAMAIDPDTNRQIAPSGFSWRVDQHHGDASVTPLVAETPGKRAVAFRIPNTGDTSTDVFCRLTLTTTDPDGAVTTVTRDLRPRIVHLTLGSQIVAPRQKPVASTFVVNLDGQAIATPRTFDAVVGMRRELAAATPQSLDGATYDLLRWSDGPKKAARTFVVPARDRTVNALFRLQA